MDLPADFKYPRNEWRAFFKLKVTDVRYTANACIPLILLQHPFTVLRTPTALCSDLTLPSLQYGIFGEQCHETASSADSDSIALACTSILKIFSDTAPGKTHNMDEAGSFYEQVPCRTVSGRKTFVCNNSQDRAIFTLCCNAYGSYKTMLSIMGKSQNPWIFKKWLPSSCGVHNLNNKSFWQINESSESGSVATFACPSEPTIMYDSLAEHDNEEQAQAIRKHSDEVGTEDDDSEYDDRVVIVLPGMSLSKSCLT